jgi:hypothetical protein
MIDTTGFTEAQILNIKNPILLFNKDTYKHEFRKLSLQYHPDHGGSAVTFAHILKLYKQAEAMEKCWGYLGQLRLGHSDGNKYIFDYRSKTEFELGRIYVTDTKILYCIDNSVKMPTDKLPKFKYSSDRMRKEFERIIVERYDQVITTLAATYYVVNKPEDSYLLSDVISTNKIPLTQIAWIISRLYNLGCFLNYNGIVHNDISINTVVIHPGNHALGLLGGWWYYTKIGDKLTAMPANTFNILPNSVIEDRIAKISIVTEQIHALGRQMMGNRYGSYLDLSKINNKLAEWLTNAGKDNIVEEYQTWDTEILSNIFGPRKFVKWDLKKEDVYTS